jgi:hypothetical protein
VTNRAPLIVAIVLLFLLAGCTSRTHAFDKSSPAAAWSGLVKAMQRGDLSGLKQFCTEEGWASLEISKDSHSDLVRMGAAFGMMGRRISCPQLDDKTRIEVPSHLHENAIG